MTVNGYLMALSSAAVIRDREKEGIQRSISGLQSRLDQAFGDEIREDFIFGSYTRGTILPRSMDKRSDIDYMIVFRDSSSRPQTYLDRLRRFVKVYYSRSEIAQSSPTIALSLNHIKFELVPATYHWWHGLRIPARRSDYNDWISTNPNDVNEILVGANKSNGNLIKPMIRLVKYWNARNRYPFQSFELERMLADKSYFGIRFRGQIQLKDYFFDAMRSLEYCDRDAQYKIDAIDRAHDLIARAEDFLSRQQDDQAERAIKRLLPPPTRAQ
ncbi:hypothetical protein MWU49_08770 [Alcanivorax sp. S6407]|uniref:SMODS domain-containing nucleotidyltransferase n=1 Tax=Alcanivorax sp. S6407 TaxID=2926424 RepID=UPI001FF426C6|nr:hypothetical protein [Alcanivorax sp. S6407]